GSTYFAKPEIFLETVGHVGFAPVDLAVDPAGDLFIAIGGRGTRGGVFRIRADRHGPLEPLDGPLIDQVLQADQPLSSWSRAKWLPIAHALGNKAFEGAAVDPLRPVPERIRAIEILVDVHGGVIAGNFFKAAMNGPPELTARIAWALGCHAANDDAQELLSKLTVYGDAYIQRTAWEAIARCSAWKTQRLHYLRAATDADRRTFFAMLNAIAGLEVNAKPNSGSYLADHAAPELPLPNSPQEQLKQLLGPKPNTWTRWRTDLTEDFGVNDYVYLQKWVDLRRDELNDRRDPAKHLSQAADEARFLKLHENLLAALAQIRMIQILLGDFRAPEDQPEFLAGYSGSTEIISKLTAEQREAIETPLLDMLGRGDRFVNLEVARTLAMIACADAGLPEKLALQLKPSASPQDDFHYLICLAKTTAPRSRIVTMATARTLAELHDKHAAQEEFPRDNHPKHLAALTTLLVERDPALPAALVADPKFGRAEHVIFAQVLPQEARLQAVEELFAAAEVREDGGDEDAWSSELVALAADLPPEVSAGTLRRLCRDPGLRDAAVVSLAKYG
ncbi:MAG TPA: hypothetical protein VGE52_14205, partial [Pirellulales bacterium]